MRGIEAYGVGLTCCCALVACLAGAVACGKEEPAAGYAPHGKRSDQEEDAKDASTAPRRGTAGDDEPVPGDPSGELVATGDCSADDVLPENLGWNPNAGQFLTCPKDAEKLTTMLGDLSLSLGTADLDGCFRCLREIRGDLHFYGKNLSAAEFPSLRSIGGSVRFEGTTIESLRFPVLTRLGGIYIRSNTTLHELTRARYTGV